MVRSECVLLGLRALRASQEQFIFVGRLITDKARPEVARSIGTFRRNFPDWSLFVYGNGPCAKSFEGVPGVSVRSFAQPTEVAEAMRNSTFVILPSRVDHWPLVVYEASLSGCRLVLSDCVGKILEFMAETAGFVCRAGSVSDLIATLHRAARAGGNLVGQHVAHCEEAWASLHVRKLDRPFQGNRAGRT